MVADQAAELWHHVPASPLQTRVHAGWVWAVKYGPAMGAAGLSPQRIASAVMVPRFSWVPGHLCSSI